MLRKSSIHVAEENIRRGPNARRRRTEARADIRSPRKPESHANPTLVQSHVLCSIVLNGATRVPWLSGHAADLPWSDRMSSFVLVCCFFGNLCSPFLFPVAQGTMRQG